MKNKRSEFLKWGLLFTVLLCIAAMPISFNPTQFYNSGGQLTITNGSFQTNNIFTTPTTLRPDFGAKALLVFNTPTNNSLGNTLAEIRYAAENTGGTSVTYAAYSVQVVNRTNANLEAFHSWSNRFNGVYAERFRVAGQAVTAMTNFYSWGALGASNIVAGGVLVSDATGKITNAPVSTTEVGYLAGVSSGVQSQIDTKVSGAGVSGRLAKWSGAGSINDSGFTIANAAATERLTGPYITVGNLTNTADAAFNGTVSLNGSVTNAGLTANRVMVTDALKVQTSSAVTATELGYVAGATSAIQTQINAVRVNGAGVGQNLSGADESTSIADPMFLTTIAAGYISAVGDGFHVVAGGNANNNATYTYRFLVDGVVVWTSTPTDGHPDWRFEADVIRSGGNTAAYITGWLIATGATTENFSVSSSSMTWSDGANVALAIDDGGTGGDASCGIWRVIKYKAP